MGGKWDAVLSHRPPLQDVAVNKPFTQPIWLTAK